MATMKRFARSDEKLDEEKRKVRM